MFKVPRNLLPVLAGLVLFAPATTASAWHDDLVPHVARASVVPERQGGRPYDYDNDIVDQVAPDGSWITVKKRPWKLFIEDSATLLIQGRRVAKSDLAGYIHSNDHVDLRGRGTSCTYLKKR